MKRDDGRLDDRKNVTPSEQDRTASHEKRQESEHGPDKGICPFPKRRAVPRYGLTRPVQEYTVPRMGTARHDERSVWAGRPAWNHYIFLWFFVAILAVRGGISLWMGYPASVVFHLSGVMLLSALAIFLRRTTHYRVTRQAVFRSEGFFGNDERSFPISSLASVRGQQGILERWLGCGDVMLHLKDGTQERLAGVKDPEVVSRKITALL
jgi:membrane protein YdbS with pleckstrin-like domain